MNDKPVNIAIDGPSGSGKSSLAKKLAAFLGYTYIDTGALYRALAYDILRNGIKPGDKANIFKKLSGITISFRHINGEQRVYVGAEDVSGYIRTNDVSTAASEISAYPEVRAFLLNLQRDIASKTNVIMDGRDIGTVVLPDADVKIFLTATAEERAKRRYEEQKGTPDAVSYEEILVTMKRRDKNDAERKTAPAKPADDAVMLNNSGYLPEQTFCEALGIIRSRLNV